MTYRFHRRAQPELDAAADWYEAERSGLGEEFLAEMRAGIAKIIKRPLVFPKFHVGDTRAWLSKRFSYRLVYKIVRDEVLIVSVMHTKRDAKYLRSRIRDDG